MINFCNDPGHGGKDRANRGPTGYIEADGVLQISKYLRNMLVDTGKFAVKLTRETDATLGLTERGMIAANFKADMFFIQHTNATGIPKSKVSGTKVFYSVDIPEDKKMAEDLAEAISKAIGVPNLGAAFRESVKFPNEDYYTVIDTAQDNGVKHVFLIESAFHDNIEDEAKLKQVKYLKAIAKAQFEVICKYYNIKPEMTLEEAVDVIAGKKILIDKEHWIEEARRVKYLDILFKNVAKYIKSIK